MKRLSVRMMTMAALCTAVVAVLSQVIIPLPSGVPVTLQTLAVALCGCLLGPQAGLMSIGVYLALGAIGLPVFSGFGAGAGKLVGVTGGFLWGFLAMAALCGLGARMKNRWAGLAVCMAGLFVCHLMGSVQFSLVSGSTLASAVLTATVPFLAKDALSVAAAWYLSVLIARRLPGGRRPPGPPA